SLKDVLSNVILKSKATPKFFVKRTLEEASSSTVPGFVSASLDLTVWLKESFYLVSALAVNALAWNLQELVKNDGWRVGTTETQSENTDLLIAYEDEKEVLFRVYVGFLTGDLCVDSTGFGQWFSQRSVEHELAALSVSNLCKYIRRCELPK